MFRQLTAIFPNQVYPPDNLKAVDATFSAVRLKRALDTKNYQVISGHFPFFMHEFMAPDVKTFTLLREPVARTISYLKHHKKMMPEDAHKPLEEIYNDQFRFKGMIENHMVKMFALTPDDLEAGMLTALDFEEAHLKLAKQNLRKVHVVGLTEEYDNFCTRLTGRFGWKFEKILHYNKSKTASDQISEAFRNRIIEDNAPDIRFYRFAADLIETRRLRRERNRS